MACQPRQLLLREKVKIQDKYQTPDHRVTSEGAFKDKLDIVSYKEKRTEYRRNISKNRDSVKEGKNLLADLNNIEVMNNVSFIKNKIKPLLRCEDVIGNQSFNIIHGAQTCKSQAKDNLLFNLENESKIPERIKEVLTVQKTNKTVQIFSIMNFESNPKQEIKED